MANYEELSPILYSVIGERFLRNNDLCKLLYYYPESTPNYDYNPLSQKNLDENQTKSLYMSHIYPMPKPPDIKTDAGAYICCYFNGGYEPENNTGFRNVNLTIDIICNLNAWCIHGAFRSYEIFS